MTGLLVVGTSWIGLSIVFCLLVWPRLIARADGQHAQATQGRPTPLPMHIRRLA